MTVADRLTQRHDVRNNILRLEHPKVCAGAAKTGLHLISHVDATRRAHRSVCFFQVSRRQNDLAATTQRRLAKESSKTLPLVAQLPRRIGYILAVKFACIRSAMFATVDIGHW